MSRALRARTKRYPRFSEQWFDSVRNRGKFAERKGDYKVLRQTTIALLFGGVVRFVGGTVIDLIEKPLKCTGAYRRNLA